MKKISIFTAAALIAVMTMTVSADDTNITPTGGNPFNINPINNGEALTTVSLVNQPAYTIIIPEKVEMSASTLTGTGTIKAQDVRLEKNASIKVDISSGNKFVMKTDQGAELPYTAERNNGKITDKDAGGEVARFSTVTKADGTPEEQTQTVTFILPNPTLN